MLADSSVFDQAEYDLYRGAVWPSIEAHGGTVADWLASAVQSWAAVFVPPLVPSLPAVSGAADQSAGDVDAGGMSGLAKPLP